MNGDNSLYTFHKQLRSDLEFALDQPILFKALDENGAVVSRYALIDLGFGTVDTVSIAKTVKDGVVKFVYFYDITAKKSVNISFEGTVDEKVSSPTLVDIKGPNPIEFENGYVAYEDLPEEEKNGILRKRSSGILDDIDLDDLDDEDDDDEDEDDEDNDKEEEEIIYDENEQ